MDLRNVKKNVPPQVFLLSSRTRAKMTPDLDLQSPFVVEIVLILFQNCSGLSQSMGRELGKNRLTAVVVKWGKRGLVLGIGKRKNVVVGAFRIAFGVVKNGIIDFFNDAVEVCRPNGFRHVHGQRVFIPFRRLRGLLSGLLFRFVQLISEQDVLQIIERLGLTGLDFFALRNCSRLGTTIKNVARDDSWMLITLSISAVMTIASHEPVGNHSLARIGILLWEHSYHLR